MNDMSGVANTMGEQASLASAFGATEIAAEPMTRRSVVGYAAAMAAGLGLSRVAGGLATGSGIALADESAAADEESTDTSEESSVSLPTASGFALPDGMALADDGTLGDVLVVVDMQNAYLEDQCWACTKTSSCAEKIIELIESGAVDNVVFTEYLAPENPTGTWVTYNEVNAEVNADEWLNEIIEDLQPYAEQYPLYSKSTYSSFGNPDFKALMGKAARIVITGVMSECCVLATAIDGIDTGTPLVYLTDACSGSTEEYEQMTIAMMEFASPTHTAVMTTDEYIALRAEEEA